ncbi:MAG: hypothetical protein ACRELX_09485, partial [Longimicrobiales bacterium]
MDEAVHDDVGARKDVNGETSGRMIVPEEWLPPGFAERIDRPPAEPAPARPAATAVLMRDGASG